METRNILVISEIRTEAQGGLDWDRPGSHRTFVAYTTATLISRIEVRCRRSNRKRSILHIHAEDTAHDCVEAMRRAVQNFLNGIFTDAQLEYSTWSCSCCEMKPWNEIDDVEIHMDGEIKDLFEQLFHDLKNSTIRLSPIRIEA